MDAVQVPTISVSNKSEEKIIEIKAGEEPSVVKGQQDASTNSASGEPKPAEDPKSLKGNGKHGGSPIHSLMDGKAAYFNVNVPVQYANMALVPSAENQIMAAINNSSVNSSLNAFAVSLPQFISQTAIRQLSLDYNPYRLVERTPPRKNYLERPFRQAYDWSSSVSYEFSRKVFVGGLPPDIVESAIQERFAEFGSVCVDWPHKHELNSIYPPKGYAFLLYSDEASVRLLINACVMEEYRLYICISSESMKDKPVQIRPWRLADSDYVSDMHVALDPRKTVFIGGVPRPVRAYDLAVIMNRLFGGVCYAGIDTDTEFKYPKGAGRVTFYTHTSYIAAIAARFVQIQHDDIDKRVEVKPYVLDDQQCDECQGKNCDYRYTRFFCSNVSCLRYYCDECWRIIHSAPGREYHKPLVKEGNERPRAIPYRWRGGEKKAKQQHP